MKTVFLTFSTLICFSFTKMNAVKIKRGYSSWDNAESYQHFNLYEPLGIPLQETELYSLGIDTFLPIPQGNIFSVSKANIIPVALSNALDKPVQEASDSIPQPSQGTAVIPLTPPPAVPVNAAAANVPVNNGAVFLGSGALGVINLGNGAFALGSGGIGYSDQRQQPRTSGLSPLFPPLAATPNLVPAATPSQQAGSIPQGGQITLGFQYSQPQPQFDQNGYERLDPNAAGFGSTTPRYRPLKTRNNFATATVQQLQVQAAHPSQLPAPGFGDPIPRLAPQSVTYKQ